MKFIKRPYVYYELRFRRDLTTVATHACLTRTFGATPSAVPRLEKDAKAMVARLRAERRVRNNPSAVNTNS